MCNEKQCVSCKHSDHGKQCAKHDRWEPDRETYQYKREQQKIAEDWYMRNMKND